MTRGVKKRTYRPAGRVVLRRIGEDQLLVPVSGLSAQKPCVFPMNPTGAFVWDRLSSGKTVAETAQALSERYEVQPDRALTDCEDYAGLLVDQRLLEEIP